MLEVIGALVISYWAAGFLVLLLLLLSWGEADGWSIFFLILLGIVLANILPITPIQVLYAAIAYLPLGFGWSLFRWKKHAKKVIENAKKDSSSYYKSEYKRRLKPSENISKIVNWIVAWPFSFLATILDDVFDAIYDFVKYKLIKLYEAISKPYLREIEEIDYTKKKEV